MASVIQFDPIQLPPEAEALRVEVRAFLKEEIAAGTFDPQTVPMTDGFSREFSRKVGAKGWIGMTWPKEYGGQERSFLERYVVTEEMRAISAPTRAHFTADRQSGPVLLKYAPEEIKRDVLPRIVSGDCCFCIGMSEPDTGSDLFAAKARAVKVDGGWQLNGSKVWTTNAHHAEYMIGLFRTSPATADNRRHGLTQFLVDMKNTDGITINPIRFMNGMHDFNEVVFEDAFITDSHLLGEVDAAWTQATTELAYERSGPERFLETLYHAGGSDPGAGRQSGPAQCRGHRASGGAASYHAPNVRFGERHAAGGQGPDARRFDRQGTRHQLGAGAARPCSGTGGVYRRGCR